MSRQPAARLQSSAHRFWARRMEHALVRRDVAMADDPMRSQSRSLATGCVLAAILVAGCAVLAVLRPQGAVGDAPIVMARESGAVYVRVGDVLHPAFNLASARLVARSAATPVVVTEAALARVRRGPQVGIPTAPDAIGTPLDEQPWTACDADRTVVAVGVPLPALDPSRYVLVVPRGESAARTHLLYDGWRSEVDLRNRALVRALKLDGVEPMPVSRALLDTIPEAPAVTVPSIAGAGGAGPASIGGLPVGTVVRVARADADELHVVLADGLQRIGEVAADLIRFAYGATEDIETVTPAAVAATAVVDTLPVGTFPRRTRTPIGARDAMAVCAQWRRPESSDRSSTTVLTGSRREVEEIGGATLAQADGDGPRVDAVALPAGRSAYVQSARVLGDDGAAEPRFVVTNTGVTYGIRDADAGSHLGLGETSRPAPWSILAQLPQGPELSTEAASIVRDGPSPS